MKLLVIICGLIILTSKVLAGPIVIGNGGNGVIKNGQVYLLDLIESSCDEHPFFNSDIKAELQQDIEKIFDLHMFPVDLMAIKLTELKQLDKVFAYSILSVAKKLRWSFVNYRLKDTYDPTPIVIEPGALAQIGVRVNDNIMVDISYWNMMSPEHKTAFVFHEIFNSYVAFIKNLDGEEVQSGLQVRQLVGLIFSPQLKNYDSDNFTHRIERLFPSRTSLFFSDGLEESDVAYGYGIIKGKKEVLFRPFFYINGLPYMPGKNNLYFARTLSKNVCSKVAFPQTLDIQLQASYVTLTNLMATNGGGFSWRFFEDPVEDFQSYEISVDPDQCVAQINNLTVQLNQLIKNHFYFDN